MKAHTHVCAGSGYGRGRGRRDVYLSFIPYLSARKPEQPEPNSQPPMNEGDPMPVTKEQAELIAKLMVECRPLQAPHWDRAGCVTAIGKVKHKPLAEVIHAAIRLAEDFAVDTPYALAAPGPQWREKSTAETWTGVRHSANGCVECGQPEERCRRTPELVSGHTYRPPGSYQPIPTPPEFAGGVSVSKEKQ